MGPKKGRRVRKIEVPTETAPKFELGKLHTHQRRANHSLFFDVKEMTILLEEYTLFVHVNLCYPTTWLHSYFSKIFAAHLYVCSRMMGLREALHLIICVHTCKSATKIVENYKHSLMLR